MPIHDGPPSGLGRRLAGLRSRQGLTQQELARRLGLTQSAVSRIESGERRLSAAQLIRWAEVLGADLATLAGLEETGAAGSGARPSRQAAAYRSFAGTATSSEAGGPHLETGGDEDLADRTTLVDDPLVLPPRQERRPGRTCEAGGTESVAAALSDAGDALLLRSVVAQGLSVGAPTEEVAGQGHPVAYRRALAGASPTRGPSVAPAPGLEPTVFAEVVADTLALEELASCYGLSPRTPFSWAERRLLGSLSPEPAHAARFWRHELGVGAVGPLPDLVTLLEEAGVYVVLARLDDQVPAGACAELTAPTGSSSGSRSPDASSTGAPLLPFVFVNGARPVVLQRFALAHEFAHLALGHRDAYDERIDWSGRSGRETSANAFAEEFTAPVAGLDRWLEGRGRPEIDVNLILDLANHFGISFWAARYRLRAAGRLPARRLRELDESLRRREWELIPQQTFLGGLRDTLSVLTAESQHGVVPRDDQGLVPHGKGLMGNSANEPRAGERSGERDATERGANLLRVAPRGVRVPARTRALALALLQRGLISLEQTAALLRFDVPSLREQLSRLGL
jgi:transcriptional regulator with XRE-family HTH domain/Zn-dependent peptidase ImmA (M78 family)